MNSTQERSIANYDEDSVTMAVAAGVDCLRDQDRQAIDGLFLLLLPLLTPKSSVPP